MTANLKELESQLRSTLGCWSHYRLRVWREYRSIDAAGAHDRIKIAEEVLAASYRGELVWAWGGWHMLLDEIQTKLNDADPHIRQDACIALAEFGTHASAAIPVLLDRLRSPQETPLDRTLSAWALPRIGVAAEQGIPVFLAVLVETAGEADADEMRRLSAEAIESLSDSFRVLVPLARRCLLDRFWKCRMHGLMLVEQLVQRERRLLPMLVPNVEPLLSDEVEEVRKIARRIVDSFGAV